MKALFRKELLDVLRDRRTLFSMIVVPLVAFPAIIGGASFFAKQGITKIQSETLRIFVPAQGIPEEVRQLLEEANLQLVPLNTLPDTLTASVPAALIREGNRYRILYDGASEKGQEARRRIREVLQKHKEIVIRRQLEDLGVPPEILSPLQVQEENLASKERMGGMVVGMFLGYILVIFMFTSAMYAAMDLTVGEKERRTLEVLLSAAPYRRNVVMAKISVVTLVAVVTSIILVIGWILSMLYMGAGLFGEEIPGGMTLGLSAQQGLLSFLVLLPFAVFVASVEVAIASFARSYREAQSYLSPLMILVILPAMVTLMPGGSDLGWWKSLVPVLNVSDIFRQILQDRLSMLSYGLTLGSSLLYAAVALGIAVFLFQREEILFRE